MAPTDPKPAPLQDAPSPPSAASPPAGPAAPPDATLASLAEALTVLAAERLHAQGLAIPGEVDAAFDLERVYDSDPAYIGRLRRVLTLLGPARAHAVILRVLEKPYYYGKAAAVADVWHDEAVVEAVLARFERPDAYVDAELLGYNGPQVVPALARHARSVTRVRSRQVVERLGIPGPICFGHGVEITLDVQNAESFAAFARLIEPEPAVMLAWQTAPTVDFTLVLTVRDMPEYQALVQRLFTAANNVRNVRARFATQRVKFSTALPLPVTVRSA